MAKRRRSPQVIPAHAEAIARTASSSVGIGWDILLPIAADLIAKLLPQLMGCRTPDKTTAELVGYNETTGEFSSRAVRIASAQVRESARQENAKLPKGDKVKLSPTAVGQLACAALHEAIRPTTNLAACAAELTVSAGE